MFEFGPVLENWPIFIDGLVNTVLICVSTFLIGGVLAVPIAVVRFYQVPVLDSAARIWVYVFRGTPLLIQTYLLYYGLAEFDWVRESVLWPVLREAWWCILISFSVNTSAYLAEILRVAMLGVPAGELEAAVAIGLTRWQRLKRIVFPRAIGIAMPMIGNEAIFKVHSSAIASVVTVVDLLGAGSYVNARYYLPYEGYIASAAIYFALITLIIAAFAFLERRMLAYLRPRTA